MHELASNDPGEPASVLEVEVETLCLEELAQALGEMAPFGVPVGQDDHASTAADEVVGRAAQGPSAMDGNDRPGHTEPAERGAVPDPLDDHDRSGERAVGAQTLPELDERSQRLGERLPGTHPRPSRGVAPGRPAVAVTAHLLYYFDSARPSRRSEMPDHYSQLLEWRRNEAAVRGLAKLPHDFYRTTTVYLTEVRRSYEVDLRENPSGRKGEISRQTYQRASQIARDIVEARAQKVLAAAFQASVGAAPDLPNSLAEERAMFDGVLATLAEHRRTAAPYLEPLAAIPAPGPSAPSSEPARSEPAPRPPATAPSTGSAARPSPPLAYVRVLKSGRPLEVGAETIDVREDDVLSLPTDAAKLLVDAKVAEPVLTEPHRTVT